MAFSIELVKHPNQSFYTNVNGHRVDFRLRTYRGLLYADVKIDDVYAVAGRRCVSGVGILHHDDAVRLGGNFVFATKDDAYPDYSDFDGISCVLGFVEG